MLHSPVLRRVILTPFGAEGPPAGVHSVYILYSV
jgi:hypothetical protein